MQDMKQLLSCLDRVATQAALEHAMKLCSSSLGFESFLVLMLTSTGGSGTSCRIVAANIPDAFQVWCQEQTETVMRFALGAVQRVSPAFSRTIGGKSTGRGHEREFLQGASSFGLGFSLTAQQQTSPGVATICIFLSSSEPATFEPDWAARHASLFACYAHEASLRASTRHVPRGESQSEDLSEAERTCLALRAQGLDAAEIAAIMKVSPRTITYYLYRSMQKLGARRPAEAVTKALMRNQISTFDLSTRAWDRSDCFLGMGSAIRHPLESLLPKPQRQIESARSIESLAAAVADSVGSMAPAQFAFTSQVRVNAVNSIQFVITNYGEEYRRTSTDQAEVRFNPMFGGGPFKARPFSWSRVKSDTKSCNLVSEHLIGVTAMVRSSERVSVLSLVLTDGSGSYTMADLEGFVNQLVRSVHDTLGTIDSRTPSLPNLTALEISCLDSLASGQGLKNAAVVLQCSTRMARYHMEKVARKLGTTTIAEGVARATELGLLPVAWSAYFPHELTKPSRFHEA